MDWKKFLGFWGAIIAIFLLSVLIRNYRPDQIHEVDLSTFPLIKNGWVGQNHNIDQSVIDMLNPNELFSATYTNGDGVSIQLFFDYFSASNRTGGPHSPRNCLPGSGWAILDQSSVKLDIENRSIDIARFNIAFKSYQSVMDFWYITKYGETSNDYVYKLYLMLSSLTLQPADRAYVRIICDSSPNNLEALKHFEETFVTEIYRYLNIK
ncbi:MAG: EpsI family protein [candidate division Zixibacteria bacterium]|nr:EpsI family protein [candidate division Zixibacteria bacterium]